MSEHNISVPIGEAAYTIFKYMYTRNRTVLFDYGPSLLTTTALDHLDQCRILTTPIRTNPEIRSNPNWLRLTRDRMDHVDKILKGVCESLSTQEGNPQFHVRYHELGASIIQQSLRSPPVLVDDLWYPGRRHWRGAAIYPLAHERTAETGMPEKPTRVPLNHIQALDHSADIYFRDAMLHLGSNEYLLVDVVANVSENTKRMRGYEKIERRLDQLSVMLDERITTVAPLYDSMCLAHKRDSCAPYRLLHYSWHLDGAENTGRLLIFCPPPILNDQEAHEQLLALADRNR